MCLPQAVWRLKLAEEGQERESMAFSLVFVLLPRVALKLRKQHVLSEQMTAEEKLAVLEASCAVAIHCQEVPTSIKGLPRSSAQPV